MNTEGWADAGRTDGPISSGQGPGKARGSGWENLAAHRGALRVLRVALGGVFLYAGIRKIGDPQAFADSLATFAVLPNVALNLTALSLPPFEILLGGILIAGWKLRAAAFGATLLAVIFAGFLGQGIVRGLTLDCGCFGPGDPSLWATWLALVRAMAMAGASAWIWRRAAAGPGAPAPWTRKPVSSAPKSRGLSRDGLP